MAGHAHGHDAQHAPAGGLDAWHTHSATEAAPQASTGETIKYGQVLFFGIAGFLVIVVAVVATVVYFNWYKTKLMAKVEEQDVRVHVDAAARKATVDARLNEWGWADPAAGKVKRPITNAAEAVVKFYGTPAK
jgi:hypothetical protein